ncbi:hypothetical protein [Flavobacterium cellulosilyticum]|uniref:DUF695 domain-containing protein n=1 Tax=Flavobacterium cellulosilyticum TaxID=2541731 RepID=A0A4V2Z024_9FLAO|nr:hypothetical protein [Flavobacterium cellulosilyticum]TDD99397.1 hypothetical protein E0F76_01335 [Flavobacterium cellulosilyticum]
MKKINTFWNWFQDNNQTIKNLINETPKNQKNISFWINKNLNYYCREIDFIIVFPKNDIGKTELIITANGNPKYFKQVITLVDNAPQLKSWKFTAFIQPTERINEIIAGLDTPYVFQEITLKISELKFKSLDFDENTKKWDIIIFLKNYTLQCNTKTLKQAVFIILQDLLGEKSLCQNINLIHLAQMPDNNTDMIYLYDLQMVIDTQNSK